MNCFGFGLGINIYHDSAWVYNHCWKYDVSEVRVFFIWRLYFVEIVDMKNSCDMLDLSKIHILITNIFKNGKTNIPI